MKDINPTIALYKEAITLEEKRASLQAQLDQVISQLSEIKERLFDAAGSSAAARVSAPRVSAPKAARVTLSGKRARRGELKSKLLSILSAAGSSGISVKEITASIGAKPTSVHSWLQSARKQYPIKRVSQGRYRIEGNVSLDAPAKGRRGRKPGRKPGRPPGRPPGSGKVGRPPGRPPGSGKVGRPPGRPAKRSTRPLSKRGELMSKIMGALQAAGADGVKIPELADKFGVKRKNLFIWFATTGRRNPAIKKVGESHYRLEQ
jgi:hypothetical protein